MIHAVPGAGAELPQKPPVHDRGNHEHDNRHRHLPRDECGAPPPPAPVAHATNSTAPDSNVSMAMRVASIGSCEILACSSPRAVRFLFRFVSGNARSRSLAMIDNSVCACVIDTPGFRRPLMVSART